MSVIEQSGLVLTGSEASLSLDHPIIGWQNLVTAADISATTSDPEYPVTNLANPSTHDRWRALNASSTTISIVTGTANPIDYIAIAKHNLSSIGVTVKAIGDAGSGPFDLTTAAALSNDGPTIFRFTAQSLQAVGLVIGAGASSPADIPEIAVVYAGKLLTVQRKINAGHTPLPMGRSWKATDGMSESGNYLGRITLSEFVKTSIPFSLLDPDWYRANMDPFLAAAQDQPFFFAQRPHTYAGDVGYAWLTAQPAPAPTAPSNLFALTLNVSGVT